MEEVEQHARNLKKLIEEKNYGGLESYLISHKPQELLKYHPSFRLIDIAVKQRDVQAINVLIAHGADYLALPDANVSTSEERLFLAALYNDENDPQFRKRTCLATTAVYVGSLEEIKYWHEEKGLFTQFDYSRNVLSPLLHCCQSGYNDCVEYLVTKVGCDVHEEIIGGAYSTPLKIALAYGQTKTADLLVTLGADVYREITSILERNYITYTNTFCKRSLVHHLCLASDTYRIQDLNEKATQAQVEGMKWALNRGIDYDKDCPISDDYGDSKFDRVPALVLACLRRASELMELLINDQREKWVNNGGALLEISAVKYDHPHFPNSNERLIKVVELLLPLVDPSKKEGHLANALASAIMHQNYPYEAYLQDLGADLIHVTKKEKYHFLKAKHFHMGMKLARDFVDVLTEQNETNEYVIERVNIPTRTAKLSSVRKKMKSIPKSAEIFFEMNAEISDPEYETIWKHIHYDQAKHYVRPHGTQILLLDKSNGKIYKGVPAIEEMALEKKRYQDGVRAAPCNWDASVFHQRFAVFALTTPEDEGNLIFPKGYRIMFKPATTEKKENAASTYNFNTANNYLMISNHTQGSEKVPEGEEVSSSHRATRAAKRKLEPSNEEQTASKRRKTRK